MKPRALLAAALLLSPTSTALALDGDVGTHDPATVVESNGKYFTYGTGGGLPILMSDDGWTWRRAGSVMSNLPGGRAGAETLALGGGNTWAPDVIKVGDNYFMYFSAPGQQPKAAVGFLSNKTLDPDSPDYQWVDGGPVASSDGLEDCNAIDPGVMLDPTTGRLWMSYGSYFGYIRLVELDPKTGKRLDPNSEPVDVAINCEASIPIYHDGWYYLLANHGSCCAGASSTYNIRVGRSKEVTGPYVDNMGVGMLEGGGKLFLGSSGRVVGAGHFGLIDLGDGVQKFSCHWEADLDRGGQSVLDIRPLLWEDGWPVAGENLVPGTFRIQSARTGTALELAVEGQAVGGGRGRGGFGGGGGFPGGGRGGPGAGAPGGGGPGGPGGRGGGGGFPGGGPRGGGGPAGGASLPSGPNVFAQFGPGGGGGGGGGFGQGGRGGQRGGPPQPVPAQDVAQVSVNWPEGDTPVRLSNYMLQAQQKWEIAPAEGKGGYLGAPYYRIRIAGTERSLAATANRELTTVAEYTGADEQLWRIDQLTDGTYRIMPKAVPGTDEQLALSAIGSSFATLSKFDPDSDKHRWRLAAP